jgi:hypothetical protein
MQGGHVIADEDASAKRRFFFSCAQRINQADRRYLIVFTRVRHSIA